MDSDGDGVCDTDEIPGCTDDSAVNFDPTATDENGTCQYAGCTDSAAENYSANAISDDGSCEYLCIGIAGCTYPGATNYQANANCEDGSCEFPPFANDLCIFDLDGNGFIGAADLPHLGGLAQCGESRLPTVATVLGPRARVPDEYFPRGVSARWPKPAAGN